MGDPATYAVPFRHVKFIRLALLDTIKQTSPTLSPTALAQTQASAEAEWLRLLNASLPKDSPPLTIEHVVNSRLHYSYEFHWLAQHYASQLSGSKSDFWRCLVRRIIGGRQQLLARIFPLAFAYRQLPALLRPITVTPLQIQEIGLRTVKAAWSANDALKPIEQEYEDLYLQDTEGLLKTTLKEIPTLLDRQQRLFVQHDPNDVQITYGWTVGWQERPPRSAWIPAIGLAATVALGVWNLTSNNGLLLSWVVLIPFLAAVIWSISIRMRRALGEQEYARCEADLRADEQVELLEQAQRIDRELHSVLSLERVLALILDWAIRFTFADTAAVLLVDAKQEALYMGKHQGFPRELASVDTTIPISWEIGIAGKAARTGQTYYLPDVSQAPDYVSLIKGMQSQLVVPIKRDTDVIAVLTLEKSLRDSFSAEEQRRIELLCGRAAIAIINAELLVETQREREKLRTLLANLSEGVIVTDHDGKLILVNQYAVELFNLDEGRDYTRLHFRDTFANTPLNDIYHQENGMRDTVIRVEVSLKGRNFEVTRVPVQHVGYSLVLHDITPFKQLDQLKTEFVQMFSHDIKNPIGTIIGSLGYIEMTQELGQRAKDNLARAERAALYINQLIEDLLHMTKLEAGLVLDLKPTRLSTLIAQAAEDFRPNIENQQLSLEILLPPNLPLLMIDSARVTQILNNLMSNAIKYTPTKGQIALKVRPIGNMVQVTVQDTGIGIPPEYLPTIFDKFVRVRSADNDQIKGTGIGLAIVRRLVEVHGGSIHVESTLGQGASFIFTLPCA